MPSRVPQPEKRKRDLRPLRDVGRDELRKLEEDVKRDCGVCTAGNPPSGHHHHFCLECARALTAEEEKSHGKEWVTLSQSTVEASHDIQFCPICAPPRELHPSSAIARQAEALFEIFGEMFASALEAERLLSIEREWHGRERLVPRETWPPLDSSPVQVAPGMTVSLTRGLRHALKPLGLMPSTILEDHGQRVLGHPALWMGFQNLIAMASAADSRGDAARHEIRTIAALFVGDPKPKLRYGPAFDRWLLEEFEKRRVAGDSTMEAYSDLVNRTGVSLLNVRQRISRGRDKSGTRRRKYVERKGPARAK